MIITEDVCSILMNPGEPLVTYMRRKAISSYEKYQNKKKNIIKIQITSQPDSFGQQGMHWLINMIGKFVLKIT